MSVHSLALPGLIQLPDNVPDEAREESPSVRVPGHHTGNQDGVPGLGPAQRWLLQPWASELAGGRQPPLPGALPFK